MSVDALKLELINKIMSLKDAYKLQKIEATLREMNEKRQIIEDKVIIF